MYEAQKKAFNIDWNNSLYNKKIPDIKKIIYVPCLCHKILRSYIYIWDPAQRSRSEVRVASFVSPQLGGGARWGEKRKKKIFCFSKRGEMQLGLSPDSLDYMLPKGFSNKFIKIEFFC